jgi:glycosyltransferase involved in cell wall biosynthesis
MRAADHPLVSIVLPTCNRLRFLRPAVESLFAQSFDDWELVIADDGSDQPTRRYLQALNALPRVQLVWLSHCGTPAIVRNAALRQARGSFVAFMDSDDLWMPTKLQRQIDVLRSRPRCRWSYTAFSQIDGSGATLAEEATRRWVPYEGSIFEPLTTGGVSIRTPSVLASRALILRAGGFDETLSSAEDYDLWLRLALESDIAIVDEPLVLVRRHDENHSRAWQSAFVGRDRALSKLQDRVDRGRRSLLRKERVNTALILALTHAALGESAGVLQALCRSVPYSWSYPHWWLRGAKTLLRANLPQLPAGGARHDARRD